MKTLAASGGRVASAVAGAAIAAVAATAVYATAIERTAFRIRRERIRILPSGARPITILHLADLHLAPWQRAKREWVQSLTDTEPDLVINTGDSLGHCDAVGALAETLAPFAGVPGVFVHGSNDYFGPEPKNPLRYFRGPSKQSKPRLPDLDTAALERDYANLGWLDLNNQARGIEIRGTRLELFGVNDPHRGWDRLDAAAGSLAQLREHVEWSAESGAETVTIGVAHAPYQRVLNAFVDAGADAIFAGHTHGGQVRIPGGDAIVTNCDIPRAQASGLSTWRHDGRSAALNVSQGIGTSIYAPVRLGTPPEAVVVTLEPRDMP